MFFWCLPVFGHFLVPGSQNTPLRFLCQTGTGVGDILYCFCQEKKVRKNKIFKNNELKIDPLFRNTSPSDSVHRVVFDFDESLALNEL